MKGISLAALTLLLGLHSLGLGAFVINEVDIDTPSTDYDEFIELKGDPFESTDGWIVVVYSRKSSGVVDSRHTFDIGGKTADANGYFVLGGTNVIEADYRLPDPSVIPAAPGAIALYQASASSFPTGTLPTSTGLQDVLAFVSSTTDRPPVDWSALGSPTVYDESAAGNVTILTLSRIPDGTGPFQPAGISAKGVNNLESYRIAGPEFITVNQETALIPQLQTAQITNNNLTPITVTHVHLGAGSSPQITLTGTPALPRTLAVNESLTIDLNFVDPSPGASTTYTAVIDVTIDSSSVVRYRTNTFTHQLVRGTPAAVGSVVINELCYNPNGADHNRDGTASTASVQPDEFLEIYNTTPNPVLIEGWEQRNINSDATATTYSFIFPAGTTIAPHSYMTIFANGTPTGFAPGTTFVAGQARLRNTGASCYLSDGSKYIDAIAYLTPNLPSGFVDVGVSVTGGGSIGRSFDGSTAWASFPLAAAFPPTPNLANATPSPVSDWTLY